MIRITSKREGFRRAGVAHPKEATEYPADRFSKKELAALEAEPQLVVEILEEKKPATPQDAGEKIALINAAKTKPALENLAKDEDRAEVLEAILKRRKILDRPNEGETIKLIKAAKTIEALDKLAENEDRKKVAAAIEKRRAELEPAK